MGGGGGVGCWCLFLPVGGWGSGGGGKAGVEVCRVVVFLVFGLGGGGGGTLGWQDVAWPSPSLFPVGKRRAPRVHRSGALGRAGTGWLALGTRRQG